MYVILAMSLVVLLFAVAFLFYETIREKANGRKKIIFLAYLSFAIVGLLGMWGLSKLFPIIEKSNLWEILP